MATSTTKYRITASRNDEQLFTEVYLGAADGKEYDTLEAAEAVAQMLRDDAPDYGQSDVAYAVETVDDELTYRARPYYSAPGSVVREPIPWQEVSIRSTIIGGVEHWARGAAEHIAVAICKPCSHYEVGGVVTVVVSTQLEELVAEECYTITEGDC